MTKNIAIIGVGGKMGIWFAKYFLTNGYEVIGYDNDNEIKTKGVSKANSLVGAVLKTDYVMLCTPTRRTPEIIRLIAKEMKRDSYLIEISSQKSKTAASLAKMPAKINPVCIHPMFGPGAKKLRDNTLSQYQLKMQKKNCRLLDRFFQVQIL